MKTGIDTAEDNRWRLPLQIHTLLDELSGSMYGENIRAAHEGLFVQGYVVYTIPYGYTGETTSGNPTRRNQPQ